MTLEAIEKARCEAEEFIRRADTLANLIQTPDRWGTYHGANYNPKEHAALRRQSMELTRALADLRRS